MNEDIKCIQHADYLTLALREQDKSSDIEQQPPFGDRKLSNTPAQMRQKGVVTKPAETSYCHLRTL